MLYSRTQKTNWALEASEDDAGVAALQARVREGLVSMAGWLGNGAKNLMARLAAMRRQGAKPRRLELVETLALGGKRQLFVVLCDDQRYLVGAGAESVGTIVALEPRPKPPEKAAKGPHLVRDRHRGAGRIVSADPLRRKTFETVSETGDLWQ